ncbi:MAG: FAD-binding oxidoreductase [Candidatus Margulisiibacteriota bacterium]
MFHDLYLLSYTYQVMLIKKDPSIIAAYFCDKSYLSGGHADKVFFPENTSDIAGVLKEANRKVIPVTISGAGTGTTGGRIPRGGFVISMEKMKGINSEYSDKLKTVSVLSGTTLAELDDHLKPLNAFYPPDPTETSAFIGATIANNSSGARTFKFGATRDWIQELTIVLPEGKLINIERGKFFANNLDISLAPIYNSLPAQTLHLPDYIIPETKNAAGYYSKPGMDIIDLFIGCEGTLGVIAGARLNVLPRPKHHLAFYLFLKSEQDAVKFAAELRCKRQKVRVLSSYKTELIDPASIEYFDANALGILRPQFSHIPRNACACLYIEQLIGLLPSDSKDEGSVLSAWSEYFGNFESILIDIWCAQTEKEHHQFKDLRHGLPVAINETISQYGQPKVSMDFAVPENKFDKFYELFRQVLVNSNIEWLAFGHIGDCHLHINMLPKNNSEYKISEIIYKQLSEIVVSLKGTVSAEHGIGKIKHPYLEIMYGKEGVTQMRAVKNVLDPQGILNPGNVYSVIIR